MPARPTLPPRCRRRTPGKRLLVEALEARSLPSVAPWSGALVWAGTAAPHGVTAATLDAALPLGSLSPSGGPLEALGTLGPAGTAAVDWVRFALTAPAELTVHTTRGGSLALLVPVLSLYNTDPTSPGDPTQTDPYTPDGHQLLAQDDGAAHGGAASLDEVLAPGTYYLAVSGTGNPYFNPFLADSGVPGGTGTYGLVIAAQSLPPAGPGPAVIAATPAAGASLLSSPLALRLTLDAPLDPSTIVPMANVVLLDGNGNPVQLQRNDGWSYFDPTVGAVFNAAADELQVYPEAPLAPGDYTLVLYGTPGQLDPNGNPADALRGIDGEALGSTAPGGPGQDYRLTFHVTGVEGVPGTPAVANDTLATAHDLGNLAGAGLVRVPGTIGDDPFAPGAANDVDLYHFRVTGPGHYALTAAADAGRIGSPLDSALALFRVVNGQVTLVAADGDSGNRTAATDGSTPLSTDAVIEAGLTAGDYYLAVGGAFNLPDPGLGFPYPTAGFYDPTQSYSAQNGSSTGAYVLSLSLNRDDAAPHVTAVEGLPSATPGQAPTYITVHFDKPVTLRQMGYEQDLPANPGALAAVWVHGSDGKDYHPRLLSYDDATNTAVFAMLDAVPYGPAELYLAAVLPDGSPGLTDLAGNWLVGSNTDGDYVVPFTVSAPPRVINQQTGRVTWTSPGTGTSASGPQVIGPLFANELGGQNGGADLLGHLTHSGGADYYEVELMVSGTYGFNLNPQVPPPGRSTPPLGAGIRLFTADGREVVRLAGTATSFPIALAAGTYIVEVGPLSAARTGDLDYRLRITLAVSSENAVALTTGAAPPYALSLQRGGTSQAPAPPASSPPGTPVLNLPSPGEGGGVVVPIDVTRTAPAGPSEALALPSGALVELSAPPVGGARAADAAPAPSAPVVQLALPALPSAPATDVRPAVLADAADGDAGAPAAAGQAAVVDHVLRALAEAGGAAVARLLRAAGEAWERLPRSPGQTVMPPAPPAAVVAEAGPVVEDEEGPPEVAAAAPARAVAEPARATDWLWASGLLATAGGVVALAVARRPHVAWRLSRRQASVTPQRPA